MSYIFYLGSGIKIPIIYKNEEFYKNIKLKLTRYIRDYKTKEINKSIFYYENENYLLIPRFFPVYNYINNYTLTSSQLEPLKIDISHNIKPKSEVQKRAMDFIKTSDKTIIKLFPGVGKTVLSIYIIAELKLRSLIFMHRETLVEQWIERIISFSDCKKDEILILSSHNIEELKNEKYKIILLTNQSFLAILRKFNLDYTIDFFDKYSKIGILIGDEIHTTVGATKYSLLPLCIGAKYIYGLSATPERGDGNTDILKYNMGEIYEDSDSGNTVPAKINFILFDYNIDIKYREKYLRPGGIFDESRYYNLFKNSNSLNKICIGLIKKLKDKNIIFVAERLNFLEQISNNFSPFDVGKLFGKGTLNELDKRITFATPLKIRDGLDKTDKNCLILTSPIRNIHQMVGRMVREHEGKDFATVFDLIDIGAVKIREKVKHRLNYYNERKFEKRYFYINKKGKTKEIDENEFNGYIK